MTNLLLNHVKTFLVFVMFFLLTASPIVAETIDDFVTNERGKSAKLWRNGTWTSIDRFDRTDVDGMLRELYRKISYNEGKPKKWVVLESKEVDFGYGSYLIVRVEALGKQRMHFFSTTKSERGFEAR